MNGMYGGFGIDPFAMEPFVEAPAATADALGVAGFLFGFLAIFYFAMFAFGIVCYILQSLGLYTVAKRRGINNPWLAWIPVGDLWILGSISDQYQYVAKGKVRNRRKTLLGLYIAMFALLIVDVIAVVAMSVAAIVGESMATAGAAVILSVLFCIAVVVLAILVAVFTYIALYDFYASCEPSNATTYLVLSIFFNIAMPFFIFFSRKKDLGMPPRREETPQPAYQPVQQPVLPVVEQTPVAEETPVETPEVAETPEETE